MSLLPNVPILVKRKNGKLSIETLCFEDSPTCIISADKKLELTHEVEWATYGQQILKNGKIVNIADIIHEFYDIRHILALGPFREDSRKILDGIYGNYPEKFNYSKFREKGLEKLKAGMSRSRYFHNCVGLSQENIFILQREGTPEELAQYLSGSGANDAIILDNGGSVACWVWWIYRSQDRTKKRGGFIFTASDYRHRASSIIAFKLRGPV